MKIDAEIYINPASLTHIFEFVEMRITATNCGWVASKRSDCGIADVIHMWFEKKRKTAIDKRKHKKRKSVHNEKREKEAKLMNEFVDFGEEEL